MMRNVLLVDTASLSLRDDHDWQRASRGPQVVGCCHSGSGQRICYEDDRHGDMPLAAWWSAISIEIGWLGNWVPCEPGRRLAAWPRGRRERYDDGLMVSEMDGRPVTEGRFGQTGTTWFAAAVFGTSYGKPRGLWCRQIRVHPTTCNLLTNN